MNAQEFNQAHRVGKCFYYVPFFNKSDFKQIVATKNRAWDTLKGQTLVKIIGRNKPVLINLLEEIPNGEA